MSPSWRRNCNEGETYLAVNERVREGTISCVECVYEPPLLLLASLHEQHSTIAFAKTQQGWCISCKFTRTSG